MEKPELAMINAYFTFGFRHEYRTY